MSSVGSTDGGYQSYKRSISELEDDYKTRRKQLEESTDASESRREENYKAARLDHEQKAESATNKIRDNSAEEVERTKQNLRSETDRVKKEYYDRFGRTKGLDAEKLKEQADTAQRGLASSEQAFKQRMSASDEAHDRKMNEATLATEREMTENTKSFRDSVLSSYEKSMADHKGDLERSQGDFRKRVSEFTAETLRDQKFNESRADTAIRDSDAARSRDISRADQSAERRAEGAFQAAAAKSAETSLHDRDSHDRETKLLRDQLNLAATVERSAGHDKANGTEQAIRTYENDNRAKERATVAAYEEQIGGMQRKAQETDRYFGQLSKQGARDKDAYYAGLIQKAGADAAADKKQLQDSFTSGLEQARSTQVKDRELSQKSSEQQIQHANEVSREALYRQSLINQDTLKNQKIQDGEQISHLEKELHQLKNSSDISTISPAAEENVRNYVGKEFTKKFDAEHERNSGNEQYTRDTYIQRMHEISTQKDDFATRSLRDKETLHQSEKQQLLDGIHDVEFSKETALRNKDQQVTRLQDSTLRSFGQSLEKQKRDYENIIDALKSDGNAKMTGMRSQYEFDRKMAQKSFVAQQNELIRESEKKLSDQKLEYEARFDEMKSQAQNTVQEAERRLKTSLEEQGRSYEQRIAQLEAQYKERERYTSQNYEDQLEKVKRSNALLIQKKS